MVAAPTPKVTSLKALPGEHDLAFADLAHKVLTKELRSREEVTKAATDRKIKSEYKKILEALHIVRNDEDNADDFWKAYEALTPEHTRLLELRKLIEEPAQEPAQPAALPYKLHPLSHFKNRPRKEWAVHEIVFDRGTSLFCGPGGSGKSAFVLDMYLSRVCNRTFLGRVVKPAFLIWVAAESLDELYPRAQGWLACNNISEDEPLNMLVLDQRMPLNDVTETEKFVISVKDQLAAINVTPETHSLVIVFDTYSKCTPGADENNTKEVKIIVELIDHIATETSAHVSIICHTNAEGNIKGNKALRDGVDTVWMVSKNNETICLAADKQRGAPELDHSIYACMRSIILDENDPTETAPVVFAVDESVGSQQFTPNVQKQMLTILRPGPLGANQWQKACEDEQGIKKSTFFAHQKALIREGLVSAPPAIKAKGAKIEYAITEKGIELLESSLK